MNTNTNASNGALVSVIIPDHNHAAYVGDAIRSALRQTYEHVEIIVVDDGSTDNSRAAVAAFGDQVHYIWQTNQGLPAARNTGIRAAHGEYIGVLDADDMYQPDYLSTLVPLLAGDPAVDAVYAGFQFVDEANNPLPQVGTRVVPPEQFYAALLDGNYLMPESMLARRRCYEQAGLFDESLRACEDWDMWIRIARDHRVLGTGRILSRHRVLPGSMSSDPKRMYDNRMAVLDKIFGAVDDPAQDAARRQAYGRAYVATALEYLQYRAPEQAYEFLRKALVTDPALAREFDVFYEIACGSQPKGSRGDFASLDMPHNARQVLVMLGRLFADPGIPAALRAQQRFSYAQAYKALGLLSYGARQFGPARAFMLHAVAANPGHALDRRLAGAFMKSLLGARLVAKLSRRVAGGTA